MYRNIIINAFLLAGFASLSVGCSRAQVVCDLVCECEHCNDQEEIVTCDQLEVQESVADAYACGDAWEALTVCQEEKGTCDVDEARFETQNDNGEDRCAQERGTLSDCIDDASAHGGNGPNF
jgi:hypothetical protein